MDLFLLVLSLMLIIVGMVGAILPALPATPLSLFGLYLYKLSACCNYGWAWLIIFTLLTALVVGLNYYIPIYGQKITGGSKYGSYGAILGLLIGLFFPPFGFIVGAMMGAFLGELIKNKNNVNGAFKSAIGSFIGFIATVGINILLSGGMMALVLFHIDC